MRHTTNSSLGTIPNMPPRTASIVDAYAVANYGVPNNTLTNIKQTVCCKVKPSHRRSPSRSPKRYPLVLFQPGLTNSRLQYSHHAATLASSGYFVATMDHAYESLVVEYPDGSTVLTPFNDTYWDTFFYTGESAYLDYATEVRIADAKFVLSQLRNKKVIKSLITIPGGPKSSIADTLDATRVTLYGHSFGGSAAVAALTRPENPFSGAINMDGWQFSINSSQTTTKPVFLFGREDHSDDPSWPALWGNFKGWKRGVQINGTVHNSFGGDLAVIFKKREVPVNERTLKTTGTLDGERSFEIVTTFVRAFMDMELKGMGDGVLAGPSKAFPEVRFCEGGCGDE